MSTQELRTCSMTLGKLASTVYQTLHCAATPGSGHHPVSPESINLSDQNYLLLGYAPSIDRKSARYTHGEQRIGILACDLPHVRHVLSVSRAREGLSNECDAAMKPTHSIPHSAFADFSRRFCVFLTAVLRRRHAAVSSGEEGAAGEKRRTHDNDLPIGFARSHRFVPFAQDFPVKPLRGTAQWGNLLAIPAHPDSYDGLKDLASANADILVDVAISSHATWRHRVRSPVGTDKSESAELSTDQKRS